MYLALTTDRSNLWWLIGLAITVAVGYFILTSISFRVYKKIKRHFAIQFAIAKNSNSQTELEEERLITEKSFKTRLYLQVTLGFVLHVNLYFIVSLMFNIFEWGYLYICTAMAMATLFFTRRAFEYIDIRKARKEYADSSVSE
jgi:hypothetical protein